MARWVYHTADGTLSHRCQYADAVKPGTAFATIDLPDEQDVQPDRDVVDLETRRVRRLTDVELAARVARRTAAAIALESQRLDIRTTLAWTIRRDMGPAVFDALSPAQKQTLIDQQTEEWRLLRNSFRDTAAPTGRV